MTLHVPVLKETRVQNFGSESTYLKYNLYISLSQKYGKTPTLYDNILKNVKMPENCGKELFCLMDKKMISPLIEWCIGKCLNVCTIFFKTSKYYLKFMLFHVMFWGGDNSDPPPIVYAQTVP